MLETPLRVAPAVVEAKPASPVTETSRTHASRAASGTPTSLHRVWAAWVVAASIGGGFGSGKDRSSKVVVDWPASYAKSDSSWLIRQLSPKVRYRSSYANLFESGAVGATCVPSLASRNDCCRSPL